MPEIIDTNNAINKQFQLYTASGKEIMQKFLQLYDIKTAQSKVLISDDMGRFIYSMSKNPSEFSVISLGEDKEKAFELEGKMQRLGIQYYKDNTKEDIKGSRNIDYIVRKEDLPLIENSLRRTNELEVKKYRPVKTKNEKAIEKEEQYKTVDKRAETGRTESLNIAKTAEKEYTVKNNREAADRDDDRNKGQNIRE